MTVCPKLSNGKRKRPRRLKGLSYIVYILHHSKLSDKVTTEENKRNRRPFLQKTSSGGGDYYFCRIFCTCYWCTFVDAKFHFSRLMPRCSESQNEQLNSLSLSFRPP